MKSNLANRVSSNTDSRSKIFNINNPAPNQPRTDTVSNYDESPSMPIEAMVVGVFPYKVQASDLTKCDNFVREDNAIFKDAKMIVYESSGGGPSSSSKEKMLPKFARDISKDLPESDPKYKLYCARLIQGIGGGKIIVDASAVSSMPTKGDIIELTTIEADSLFSGKNFNIKYKAESKTSVTSEPEKTSKDAAKGEKALPKDQPLDEPTYQKIKEKINEKADVDLNYKELVEKYGDGSKNKYIRFLFKIFDENRTKEPILSWNVAKSKQFIKTEFEQNKDKYKNIKHKCVAFAAIVTESAGIPVGVYNQSRDKPGKPEDAISQGSTAFGMGQQLATFFQNPGSGGKSTAQKINVPHYMLYLPTNGLKAAMNQLDGWFKTKNGNYIEAMKGYAEGNIEVGGPSTYNKVEALKTACDAEKFTLPSYVGEYLKNNIHLKKKK